MIYDEKQQQPIDIEADIKDRVPTKGWGILSLDLRDPEDSPTLEECEYRSWAEEDEAEYDPFVYGSSWCEYPQPSVLNKAK